MPIAYDHPMAVAARELDTMSEVQGFGAVFDSLGLDRKDVIYVAQQRALRMAMVVAGRADLLGSDKPVAAPEGLIDRDLLQHLTVMALDSLNIGWKAREINDA